ncbi:hypothetical protein KM043_002462 [Ampulex compressa]|nr:hypothetical protein KM043_002462 [Ampulex compressa]
MKLAADRGGGQKCFGHRTNMDLEEKDYYRANRILLLAIGLWPNRSAKLKRVQSALAYFVLISCTLAQVKKCVEEIESHWDFAKDEREREILAEFAERGRLRIIYLALFLYPTLFTFFLNPVIPDVLDIIVPLNESRERKLPIVTEYFVDQQTYFYPILFHIYVVALIGVTAYAASEGPMIIFVTHLCGMFVITRKRLDHVLEKKSADFTPDKDATIYEAIICAVVAHNKTLECDLQWYMLPVPAQKLLMFIILRSTKYCCFVPGGIFIASYEGFSKLMSFITTEYSLDLLLRVLSYTFIKSVYVLKYITALVTGDKIKKCVEEIETHWDFAKDERERQILAEFAEKGRLRIIYLALFLYPTLFTFFLNPVVPDVLDIIVPLNESRERKLPMVTEYFVDQQTYFYPILFHIYVVALIGVTAFTASEGPVIIFISHLCGMFVITRKRLDHVLEKESADITRDKDTAIYEAIICAVVAHNKTLEFVPKFLFVPSI